MPKVQTSREDLVDAVAEWNAMFGEADEIDALQAVVLVACDLHDVDVDDPQ